MARQKGGCVEQHGVQGDRAGGVVVAPPATSLAELTQGEAAELTTAVTAWKGA